jgi:maleate isomerase
MSANEPAEIDHLDVDLEKLPFETDRGIGSRAALGLLVLETDQTIEDEFRAVWPDPGVALYAARLHNDVQITPETLLEMQGLIAPTTKLLPFMVDLSVVAFACTSGALVIGESRVAELIQRVRPNAKVTDPVTAAIAALKADSVKRVALLTPSTFSLPACTCGSVASMPFISTWVWPATVSPMACARCALPKWWLGCSIQ